ncbi:MAG TPA: acyl-CoA desaturase, partial [Candidatus Microthrix parvicella]|nr:acyl-CoA desaturase [Candidatus Microthrix parvicella]
MTATLTPRTTTRFDQVDLDESGPNGATAPGHTEALDPKPTPRAGGLTLEQSEAFGAAMDELRELIRADLGTEDANYIRRVIAAQRKLEVGGRLALFGWFLPPLWVAGAVSLGLAKIIDNM